MSIETETPRSLSIDEYYEHRAQAIDMLAALEYKARMVGGAAWTAAYSNMETKVHTINQYGEQQGWLSSKLED